MYCKFHPLATTGNVLSHFTALLQTVLQLLGGECERGKILKDYLPLMLYQYVAEEDVTTA
jgi:hypothetical protein